MSADVAPFGADGCLTADVAYTRRGPCASPIGSESRTMRNDSVESAGSVEFSMGGDTECGWMSYGASLEDVYPC